jgi:hypothetical protein
MVKIAPEKQDEQDKAEGGGSKGKTKAKTNGKGRAQDAVGVVKFRPQHNFSPAITETALRKLGKNPASGATVTTRSARFPALPPTLLAHLSSASGGLPLNVSKSSGGADQTNQREIRASYSPKMRMMVRLVRESLEGPLAATEGSSSGTSSSTSSGSSSGSSSSSSHSNSDSSWLRSKVVVFSQVSNCSSPL